MSVILHDLQELHCSAVSKVGRTVNITVLVQPHVFLEIRKEVEAQYANPQPLSGDLMVFHLPGGELRVLRMT